MNYRGKLFWSSITISMAVLMFFLSAFYMGGVALAVPIAGVGGFNIEADRIMITDFRLLPTVGETSEKKAIPQANAQMNAKIKGLKLYKDLNVPGQGKVRVMVTSSGEVKSNGMVLDMTRLIGDHSFKKLTIKENYSHDVRKKFEMKSPHLVLKNPKIRAHYLYNNSITLPGMKLDLHYLK
ncbi:DUF6230 family protein [Melghirimyces algeriensis]|uniref:Uncharacterized protein n=1 Tax=Melghirimyces algeriensis TaxID=910412 RepID=A0A521E0Z2_9BACL|nr:DUF6230 family protein [Melghirimyces algeriensis]SMO76981.1 hypothetical protein SAMN06264849_10768 [Melghirimyces algeriensis]